MLLRRRPARPETTPALGMPARQIPRRAPAPRGVGLPGVGASLRRVGFWPHFTWVLGSGCFAASALLLGDYHAYHPGIDPIALLGAMLALGGGTTALGRFLRAMGMPWVPWGARERGSQQVPASGLRERDLPGEIRCPLERAREAYAGIARITSDPAWAQARLPVDQHEAEARAQLDALEEGARRLAAVHVILTYRPIPQSEDLDPPHVRELQAAYRAHCVRLAAAAEAFERALSDLARALLAVGGGAPGAPASEAAVHEMSAAFESLAQVLESVGGVPVPPSRERA